MSNQLPVTYDCPVEEITDGVLARLIFGREYVERGWTDSTYIAEDGAVCGLGGIFRADGLTCRRLRWSPRIRWTTGAKMLRRLKKYRMLSVDAQDAIDLLDQVALIVHPWSVWYKMADSYPRLAGPFEYVNQKREGWDGYFQRARVLQVYDEAIARRRASNSDAVFADRSRELESVC